MIQLFMNLNLDTQALWYRHSAPQYLLQRFLCAHKEMHSNLPALSEMSSIESNKIVQ